MTKRRKKKKYRFYILILFIIALGIYFYKNTNNPIIEEVKKIIRLNYIEGTIINISNNTITIITKNDSIYEIPYNNKDYQINDDIKIYYSGTFNKLNKKQVITVDEVSHTKIKLDYDDKLINIVNNMTPEEKIGALIMARVPVNDKVSSINTYHLGGYILFRRDIMNMQSNDELKAYIKSFQDESKIPMFIAIDEEGGTVSRLSTNPNLVTEPFKSPQELYEEGGFDLIKEDQIKKSNYLKELGININLAPVADVCTDKDVFIYERSFGKDADETSKFIKVILSVQTNEVTFALKHFPGYGTNLDTHKGLSVDNRSYEELKSSDFKPFEVGIENGAKIILVSHNIISKIDSMPASLSPNIHNILRNDLDFKGVIITDDLSMGAIKEFETTSPYVDAVLAGNNILITTDFIITYNDILEAYENGIICDSLLDHLVLKNLWLKEEKGLI